MLDGLAAIAVLLEPVAGTAVEGRHLARPFRRQVGLQHASEEVVVAVPAALVVERDEEQVAPVERLDRRDAPLPCRDGIRERAGEPRQDRCLQQEVAGLGGLPTEDLFDEVVDDVAVVACERRDELGRVGPALQRERRELKGRDPALRPRLERRDVVVRERQPHELEIARRLVGQESKVARPDLDEPASRPETRERHGRIGARPDDDVCSYGKVIQEVPDLLVNGRGLDDVEVVEHEHDVRRERGERVQERGHRGIDGSLGSDEDRPSGAAGARSSPIHGLDHVGPERHRVVVARVQGEPGDVRAVRSARQLGHQRGLAEPGRRRHERQRRVGRPFDLLAQSRSRDQPTVRRRQVELGLEERARHQRAVPTVNPWTKLRWSSRKTTSGGRNVMARPANRSPSFVA